MRKPEGGWGPLAHPVRVTPWTMFQASRAASGRATAETVQAETGAGRGERAAVPHPPAGAPVSRPQVGPAHKFPFLAWGPG